MPGAGKGADRLKPRSVQPPHAVAWQTSTPKPMPPDPFTQPPYDRALELLREAGAPLPEGSPGETGWTQALVQGLVQLAESARAAASDGDVGFHVGPPYVGEVSAAERAMLFVDAPEAAQEPLS